LKEGCERGESRKVESGGAWV